MIETVPPNPTGLVDLQELLRSMSPELKPDEFIFCTVDGKYADYAHLNPLASFVEPEGLTLVVSVAAADIAQLVYDATFKQITLTVHSSLEAVGLTAAVATKLTAHGISANVVAAYYHDHIFVPTAKAEDALTALKELSN